MSDVIFPFYDMLYYIDNNITVNNITLEMLSSKFFISKNQIVRVFKKNVGTTPHQYILNKKIEKAKHLLVTTNVQVKTIADKLYFHDAFHFSNTFKRYVGVAPKAFRLSNSNLLLIK